MTEQQQKLYDKLLKKVNEYCLGAAAEDVIAAIDALVESYETPKVDLTSKPLEVWSLVKKYMNAYHHQAINEKVDVETVEGHPISIIEDSLKALEIIKNKNLLWDIDWQPYEKDGDYRAWDNEYFASIKLTKEEYELLKEVLEDESTN